MNSVYFDAAYVAKCYLNEADAAAVRETARGYAGLHTSAFSIAEVACVFHRHVREGTLTQKMSNQLRGMFLDDIAKDRWFLVPVTDHVLRRVEFFTRTLPPGAFLRAADAVHIVSAMEAGFDQIWTNDRHLLAASGHFGLTGRSVLPVG